MKLVLLVCAFIFSFIKIDAQTSLNIFEEFKNGDSKSLSSYFNQNVEINITGMADNVFSKSQAEQIIKVFFNEYKPTGFKLFHKGGKDDYQYFIGVLYSGESKFRIYFLIKNNIIHQLRIEKI